MATKARQQYFADENSLQKQRREFSIADDIQQKIDSIEEGAQVNVIETVKVNGTPLIPDANKAVNVEVPEVIDNLYTIDSDNALSAKQGKILYDYIQNIASRGRFLSNWNSATGLPMTNPSESSYPYKSGDYFVVSNVAASGGTNYRPDGSSYIIGQASTVVETEDVSVSDFYFYDGTNWLLLSNSGRQIAVDSSLSATSTNPVENRVITNALNNKQDVLTAGNHIDITSNVVSTTGLQEELTAGENITIEDICTTESDMKGPCPSGFHVPLGTEWVNAWNIRRALGGASWDGGAFSAAFKLPFSGYRNPWRGQQSNVGSGGMYWASSASGDESFNIEIGPSSLNATHQRYRGQALSVRPFKNTPTAPDNTRTKLYGTSIEGGGIFWSSADELISFSSDGTTRYTMADKNLGATTVRNSGDVLSEVNGGHYYQWGNNYGFSRGSITTSSTKVDASNYGPANPYSSNIFISGLIDADWSSVQNDNLRGGVTQGTYQDCDLIISATDTTYTAGTGINIDSNNVISSTITPGQTYTAGNGINIDSNNEISVDTSVVATQIDLQDKQDLLTAGENITIGDECTAESDMKGPAPSGFHVPSKDEWVALCGIFTSTFGMPANGAFLQTYLKIPFAGYRSLWDANVKSQGTTGCYWSSTPSGSLNANYLYCGSSSLYPQGSTNFGHGNSVRCFKNSPTVPTSSWTTLYDGSSVATGAGVFWDSTNGLISVSGDGTTWYTIMDKNLGATSTDITNINSYGYYYQWGNNYGFANTGTVTTSNTQVDTTNYGPGNYYSDPTFITGNYNWSSVNNGNLWGGVTQGTHQECIHNVISANDTTYTAGSGIAIDSNNEISNTLPGPTIAAAAPTGTEGALWYDTTNDVLKVYDGSNWNITGKEYEAGLGITIGTIVDYSAMRGPCASGYHVPTSTEWANVKTVWTTLGGGATDGANFGITLKMPFAGMRYCEDGGLSMQGTVGYYYSCSCKIAPSTLSIMAIMTSTLNEDSPLGTANAATVRPFKDEPVVPTSSWTKLYGTSIEAGGIFWSSADGLISLSSDGTTWITMADKNLGATTVWNSGDTLSEANCGKYYQWGNNYAFPWSGILSDTSATQVDATGYGPGNYYYDDTFITVYGNWDSSNNRNLWGGETGAIITNDAISNTGVLSVNGQTGAVTISGGDVVVSSQTGNILQSGMKIWAGLETDYGNLGTRDSNTLYLTIE